EVGRGGGGSEHLDATGRVLHHAERELALVALQHEAAGDGDLAAGLGAGFEVAPTRRDLGGSARGLEAVGDGHECLVFFSWTSRNPCRVRKGSVCWMVSDTGASRCANPPVLTTLHPPSSLRNRSTMPSTSATKPY